MSSELSSPLPTLVDLLHYRLLLTFDEISLGRLAQSSVFFREVAKEQALWRRLATCADRLAAARYFGVLSPEASEVVSVDTDPPACHNRPTQSTIDWRDVCRQLHPQAAVRPWDVRAPSSTAQPAPAVWTELTDGWHGGRAPSLPESGLFAGHSSHMFWVGGQQLLALSGLYFAENLGGLTGCPLHDVYLIDIMNQDPATEASPDATPTADAVPSPQNCGRSLRRRLLGRMTAPSNSQNQPSSQTQAACQVRAVKLDGGTADGVLPHGHPSFNGAASDFDPIRRTAFFFGGGFPHSEVYGVTSALRLSGWDGESDSSTAPPSVRWEVVNTPGSVEAGQRPSSRQGMRGVVFGDEFIIFGGREQDGGCLNDVWALDLPSMDATHYQDSACHWRQLICDGTAPSPRVWYGSCHAVHGRWFIYGGSQWQFDDPGEAHDYQSLFILDLVSRVWSTFEPQPSLGSVLPPWTVGHSLVPLGSSQILVLGGSMPHKVGSGGLNREALMNWRRWYSRLDQPHLLDLASKSWSRQDTPVLRGHHAAPVVQSASHEEYVGEIFLRAQFAATFVPTRRSVVVFGGSRYFTGEYFHDILELRLPASSSSNQQTSVLGGTQAIPCPMPLGEFEEEDDLPRMWRRRRGLTRGLLGRLRGMLRYQQINQEQFDNFIQEFVAG